MSKSSPKALSIDCVVTAEHRLRGHQLADQIDHGIHLVDTDPDRTAIGRCWWTDSPLALASLLALAPFEQ